MSSAPTPRIYLYFITFSKTNKKCVSLLFLPNSLHNIATFTWIYLYNVGVYSFWAWVCPNVLRVSLGVPTGRAEVNLVSFTAIWGGKHAGQARNSRPTPLPRQVGGIVSYVPLCWSILGEPQKDLLPCDVLWFNMWTVFLVPNPRWNCEHPLRGSGASHDPWSWSSSPIVEIPPNQPIAVEVSHKGSRTTALVDFCSVPIECVRNFPGAQGARCGGDSSRDPPTRLLRARAPAQGQWECLSFRFPKNDPTITTLQPRQ